MGLAEKRIQQDFDTKRVPEALQYYSQQTGGAIDHIAVSIDWTSFGDDKQAWENVDSIWQQPLQGLEAVCADALGKGAVKDGLKKIVIKHAVAAPSIVFKDGVLDVTMNFREGTGGSPGWTEFQKVIENGL